MIYKHAPGARLFAMAVIFIVVVTACGLSLQLQSPTTATPDTGAVSTSAAGTVVAQLATFTVQIQATQASLISPPSTTQPPINPTDTNPTMVAANPITATQGTRFSPSMLQIVAVQATNCRMGPSTDYSKVSLFSPGVQSNVLGRNDASTWWFIQDPLNSSNSCWVWSQTTQVQGDISTLPVITPPPAPQPAGTATQLLTPALPVAPTPSTPITVAFSNLLVCGDNNVAVFQVVNNSPDTLTSIRINNNVQYNGVISTGPEVHNGPFGPDPNNCLSGGVLPPGGSGFVGGELPQIVPQGVAVHTSIVLCGGPDLEGPCSAFRVNFTNPASLLP